MGIFQQLRISESGSPLQRHQLANYAEGAPGEVFHILVSMGFLEVAANRGSAYQLLGAGKGSEFNVVMEGRLFWRGSPNQPPRFAATHFSHLRKGLLLVVTALTL